MSLRVWVLFLRKNRLLCVLTWRKHLSRNDWCAFFPPPRSRLSLRRGVCVCVWQRITRKNQRRLHVATDHCQCAARFAHQQEELQKHIYSNWRIDPCRHLHSYLDNCRSNNMEINTFFMILVATVVYVFRYTI
jgi:hypothetical protein